MKPEKESVIVKPALQILRVFLFASLVSFVAFCFFASIFFEGNVIKGLGFEVSIVQTKSMQGTINQYDFVVIKRVDAKELRTGDIVAFYDVSGNYKILHRVVGIVEAQNGFYFQTKGDNNRFNDAGYRTESSIYAIYWFKVPLLGFFITFFKSQFGLLTIALNVWNFIFLSILWHLEKKEA